MKKLDSLKGYRVAVKKETPVLAGKNLAIAEFDRDYIPMGDEARETRKQMLAFFDQGIECRGYALALAKQEALHQLKELFALRFGQIGDRQFLVELVLNAHLGEEQAMHDWIELAQSAAIHLRDDMILADMQKATDAVAMVLKHKQGEKDRARFVASYFALTWKQQSGCFPAKVEVTKFLKEKGIPIPETKNMHRFWKGAILGRLKNAKGGRKPAIRKSSSKGKSR